MAGHAITSGLEGAWTPTPTKWDNGFFDNLFGYEWELTKSPAGAHQWKPKGDAGATRPGRARQVEEACADDADHATSRCASIRPTRRSRAASTSNPEQFADAFARAWFKLTHRDMGPMRALSRQARAEGDADLAGPDPGRDHAPIGDADIAALKAKILASGLSVSATGLGGVGLGLDLPRLRQARRRQWRAHPPRAAEGLGGQQSGGAGEGARASSKRIQKEFNAGGKKVSLADLIVLGGSAAVEKAAKDAGVDVKVPFTPGRADATQEQTEVESFASLEPARRRLPQLCRGSSRSCRRKKRWSTARNC